MLRLFAVGSINAQELKILNHFDVLEEHKRNKNENEFQQSWKGNGHVFTGIKELHNRYEGQQKFFDSILQLTQETFSESNETS